MLILDQGWPTLALHIMPVGHIICHYYELYLYDDFLSIEYYNMSFKSNRKWKNQEFVSYL